MWRTSGFSEVMPQNQHTWQFSSVHSRGQLDYEGRFCLVFIFKLLRPRFTKHILEYFSMQHSNFFVWLYLWKHYVMLHPHCVLGWPKTESSELQTGLFVSMLGMIRLGFQPRGVRVGRPLPAEFTCASGEPFCCVSPLEPWAILGGNFCLSLNSWPSLH